MPVCRANIWFDDIIPESSGCVNTITTTAEAGEVTGRGSSIAYFGAA